VQDVAPAQTRPIQAAQCLQQHLSHLFLRLPEPPSNLAQLVRGFRTACCFLSAPSYDDPAGARAALLPVNVKFGEAPCSSMSGASASENYAWGSSCELGLRRTDSARPGSQQRTLGAHTGRRMPRRPRKKYAVCMGPCAFAECPVSLL